MNIPDHFFEEDTIFHYTKLTTAVNHIIPEEQLLIRRRSLQRDPIEKFYINPYYLGPFIEDIKNANILKEARMITDKFMSQISQISFCRNGFYLDQEDMNIQSLDGVGFAKQRMWATYGDNYSGVCLAFSKKEILKSILKLATKNQLIKENVTYVLNSEIGDNDFNIVKYNPENKDEIISFLSKRLFIKSFDYRDENEYRICIKISQNEFYLPIKNSLKGIFYGANYSHESNDKKLMFNYIEEYCTSKKILHKGVFFTPDSVTIFD